MIPSGLSTSEDYETTYAKADHIVAEFANVLGANTVRLPVNPYSVGTDWWPSYKAAIDAPTHRRFRVILSYREGSDAQKDGRLDDPSAWSAMWDTLTSSYRRNKRVFFEPMNEPFGYTPEEWVSVSTTWVERYTRRRPAQVDLRQRSRLQRTRRARLRGARPRGHVRVPALPRLLGQPHVCRLGRGLHQPARRPRMLPPDGARRVRGPDDHRHRLERADDGERSGDEQLRAFLQAVTDTSRARHMGSVYWPGLRTGDTYSLATLQGTGTDLSLTEGVSFIEWGWGRPPHPPV